MPSGMPVVNPADVGLAWLTFGAPVLAWGLLAMAVPVLVHLVLRDRPRRQVFPAMRFLLQAHQSSTRAHRLKYFLLLLCRMSLLLLLVALLMKSACVRDSNSGRGGRARAAGEPISAVICLDDSASMGYRFQGRSRLDCAADWAKTLLEDETRFPGGSQVAVVTGSSAVTDAAWPTGLRQTRKCIDAARVGDHDRPVALLLRKAYSLLATAAHPCREVYLLTDRTRHSWRGSLPLLPHGLNAVYVLDVGQDENRNVSLGWPAVPDRVLPAGQPVTIPLRVRSGDQAADPQIEVLVNGETRHRQAVGHVSPSGEVEVALALAPMPEGQHRITIDLDSEDALACDNRRFALVAVGELPRVLVVHGAPNDEVARLISSMIAPATLPPSEQRFAVVRAPDEQLGQARLDDARAVVLADIGTLRDDAWARLNTYVEGGGLVLIVPGPDATADTYRPAGLFMPAAVRSVEDCSTPVTLAATDLTHPYLRPFADAGVDSINDRRIFRRLEVAEPAAGATVVAAFSDGRPALVERRAGSGAVVLLAFSPAQAWGQLGSRAAPTIVLLHAILEERAAGKGGAEMFAAGQAVARRIEASGEPEVRYCQAEAGWVERMAGGVDRAAGNGVLRLPTERAGYYEVRANEAEGAGPLVYAVNVAEGESDPERMEPEAIETLFPAGVVQMADKVEALARIDAAGRGWTELAVPLALGLLALLVLESLFSNRFYGSRTGS